MKALHIFPADAKFFDVVRTSLSRDERIEHEYLLLGDPEAFAPQDPAVLGVLGHGEIAARFAGVVDGYDAVSFHFMDDCKLSLLEATPAGKIITWHSWGMDIVKAVYRTPMLAQFKVETFRAHCREHSLRPSVEVGKSFAKEMLRWESGYARRIRRALPRIDFMTTVTREEHAILSRKFGAATPRWLDFGYDWIDSEEEAPAPGRNILLGNSSYHYNNHMEAMRLLARMDLADRKVVVPLSYGEEGYKAELIEFGRRLLGDKVDFLTSFLPRDEYFRIMASCGIFVSNSKVQMAGGNIIHSLSRGLKVVLDPANPFYADLTRDGYAIASIATLGDGPDGLAPLSTRDIEMNRELILRQWGKAAVLRRNDLMAKSLYESFRGRRAR